MTSRELLRRNIGLGALLVGVVVAGAVFIMASRRRPAASLHGLQPLIADRRFDEVELRISEYLQVHPDSVQANMLMAQVALDRGEQKPRLALDHLSRIKARDPGTRAIVMLNEGKAYSALGWNDRAEAAWKNAMRLEPRVPEAGWDLLGLYYIQGRHAAAHKLAMALHAIEPDPRDRAQLLLELVRQDAQPLVPDSLILILDPLVRNHPDDLHTAIALGLALIRTRTEEGLSNLRELVERFADNPDAWDALLDGLDKAVRSDELATTFAQLPTALAADTRFERFRGAVTEQRQDWPTAAEAYFRAWRTDPSDLQTLYRLSRMLRAAGLAQDAEMIEPKARAAVKAKAEILPLYEEANAVKTLGTEPHPDLYHRLADLRERMGRDDEAVAWHNMVLEHQADNKQSNAAIARLKAAKADITASH